MKTKTVEIDGQSFTFAKPFLREVREFQELLREIAGGKDGPDMEPEADRVASALVLSGLSRVAPATKADLEARLDEDGLRVLIGEVAGFAGLVAVPKGEAQSP